MNRMPQHAQRRLLKGFAARRMGVDRRGDVLGARAHFDGERERGRELGYVRADCLNADHHMVIVTGNEADETMIVCAFRFDHT